ncbi:MAG: hypothetical protein ACOC06_00250, partial [Halorubrum sp.]
MSGGSESVSDGTESVSGGTESVSASNTGGHGGRGTPKKRVIRMIAAQAAAVSAAVHLLWAWPRLGTGGDPRPLVFVLGGAFAVAVAVATLRAPEYRRLYALGAG